MSNEPKINIKWVVIASEGYGPDGAGPEHTVSETKVMNNALGVLVVITTWSDTIDEVQQPSVSSTQLDGQHWDAESGGFVAIETPASTQMAELVQCLSHYLPGMQ